MLSKILTKEQCAACKFCCVFERESLWEVPIFSKEKVEKLKKEYDRFEVKPFNNAYVLDLDKEYKTDTQEEEVPCPFLDNSKGCILPNDDKPLDCKIWPLRIMRKEGKLVIALTPTCKAINKLFIERVGELVVDDGLGKYIYEQAKIMPEMIKEYREGFPIIMVFTEENS